MHIRIATLLALLYLSPVAAIDYKDVYDSVDTEKAREALVK